MKVDESVRKWMKVDKKGRNLDDTSLKKKMNESGWTYIKVNKT